jgi:hypothetical protein
MRESIRNRHNEIIGYIDDYGNLKEIRNKHGELIGRIVNGQTWNVYGEIVSFQENPGLLFGTLDV